MGGESGNLRESATHHNIICGNSFDGYSVAYDIGSRQGHYKYYDLSYEGRDYANYNLFENNTITNTTIGIKLNCSGNTIRRQYLYERHKADSFALRNCYSLTETTINDQVGAACLLLVQGIGLQQLFELVSQSRRLKTAVLLNLPSFCIFAAITARPISKAIRGRQRFVKSPSLIVDSGNRTSDLSGNQYENLEDIALLGQFWNRADCDFGNNFCNGTDLDYDGSVTMKDLSLVTGRWLTGNTMKDVYASGATPIDIAVGDYCVGSPDDEVAVIWDTPVV